MTDLLIRHFYHEPTGTLSYVVADPDEDRAAVIDAVLGFSVVSGRVDRSPADEIIGFLRERNLALDWILETHAHADHLSAATLIRNELGGRIAIGEGIRSVQAHFAEVFNLKPPFVADGSQFDRLFADGDTFDIGGLEARVIATPGHTSDSITYLVGDAAFVGDSLFMPDFGTARCDFPGGDASLLYDSIQRLFELPPETRLFMCHDYPPEGRSLRHVVSVAEQRESNVHVGGGRGRAEFVEMRDARDRTLNLPNLIVPAIQVNIRAGEMPPAEDNGVSYLKIPLNLL